METLQNSTLFSRVTRAPTLSRHSSAVEVHFVLLTRAIKAIVHSRTWRNDCKSLPDLMRVTFDCDGAEPLSASPRRPMSARLLASEPVQWSLTLAADLSVERQAPPPPHARRLVLLAGFQQLLHALRGQALVVIVIDLLGATEGHRHPGADVRASRNRRRKYCPRGDHRLRCHSDGQRRAPNDLHVLSAAQTKPMSSTRSISRFLLRELLHRPGPWARSHTLQGTPPPTGRTCRPPLCLPM